jgi:hypothetical protein
VSVDQAGKLHLKIAYLNGAWRCAEVILSESLGHGIYRFTLDTDIANFPDPIVVGFFTYSDDALYAHREIDVEFSNGAVVGKPNPWQFVIQPYTIAAQRHQFTVPDAMNQSSHSIIWLPDQVSFNSFEGVPANRGYSLGYDINYVFWLGMTPPFTIRSVSLNSPTNILITIDDSFFASPQAFFWARLNGAQELGDPPPFQSWSTTSGVPPAGDEKFHINAWLFNGTPPGQEGEVYEIVVSNFEFEPLDNGKFQPRLKMLEATSSQSPSVIKIQLTYPPN